MHTMLIEQLCSRQICDMVPNVASVCEQINETKQIVEFENKSYLALASTCCYRKLRDAATDDEQNAKQFQLVNFCHGNFVESTHLSM